MIILTKTFNFLTHPFLVYFYTQAGLKIAGDLSSYLKKGDKVLDLGCGMGFVGYALERKLGVKITGTDVRDVRKVDLSFVFTDGKALPFEDNSFDAVLISYVLHHTQNAKEILEEAKLVCRDKIFVYEDTPQNFAHRASCLVHGSSYGFLSGLRDRCKFRSQREWLEVFSSVGLKILNSSEINLFNPFHLTRRALFVLCSQ